jgi:hypothetical protein
LGSRGALAIRARSLPQARPCPHTAPTPPPSGIEEVSVASVATVQGLAQKSPVVRERLAKRVVYCASEECHPRSSVGFSVSLDFTASAS